jgi:hypothetical protein
MNGLEFEKFYTKYDLKLDIFDTQNTDTKLLYKSVPVCKYFKNAMTGERYISFPGKIFAVDDYDKACECFEKYCRKLVKEIDIFHKLKNIEKDFE